MSGANQATLAGEARRRAAEILRGAGSPSPVLPPGEGRSRVFELLSRLARASQSSEAAGFSDAEHRDMLRRLQAAGIEIPNVVRPLSSSPAFLAQFDEGFEGLLGAGVLRGVRARDDDEISLAGLLGGVPMDAVSAWMLATSVVTSVKARPERPVVLVLDTGPAPVAMDESVPLSEYLAHLARAIAWAHSQAVAVNTWIVGGVDDASFVACAAAAANVIAFPAAVLHSETSSPGGRPLATAATADWVSAGMVDELAAAAGRVDIAWNVAVSTFPSPPGERG